MSDSTADRNLLVGMLALQLNFVTREQLIAATSKWTRDRSRSIAEILSSDGVLSDQESTLLSSLVDMHLARHGNDPLQTLASMDVSSEARTLVEAAGDATMLETINHLAEVDPHETIAPATPEKTGAAKEGAEDIAAHQTMGPGETGTAKPQADPTVKFPTPLDSSGKVGAAAATAPGGAAGASRYTVIKPYQRGGLGQVSIARDEEINREVALKEILPKHADSEEARARFVLEAEVTGSLEHPGVVPVYGLGQYADGRPYYAMRFIRGDNLQLAIDQFHKSGGIKNRSLELRQLLGRFVDVCNAIEYAHNRCVLHRDLKPGNIMLGKYGETLVVDWGLAKSVDARDVPTDTVELPVRPMSADSTTETQMGRVVGTPAYMSPEQASGRVDMLGPATDIYSLGATLFHVLTGEAPFKGTPRDALIGNVQMGRFKKPGEIKLDIPRPLSAICLKAMARNPEDRYHSAHALAEDVERYLADEPIAAFREPLYGRIFRWMRKHRSLVVGAAGILTVTAIALTLGVILLGAANRRVHEQRQLAEKNFEMARNAVRDYFTSVSEDTLLNQSGMQPLRNQLLSRALTYYEEFLDSGPSSAEMRDELAQANYYVGRIKETIDSPASALPYYEHAIAFSDDLLRETPGDRTRLDQLADTLNAEGRALQKLGRLDDARGAYARARQLRQRLVDATPGNAEFARQLANTIMNMGTLEVMSSDHEKGMTLWERAQALRREHLAEDARLPKLLRDYGQGSFNFGNLQLERNELDAAREQLETAVRSFEKLIEIEPDDMEAQLNLALAFRVLGDVAPIDDGIEPALNYYHRAIDYLAALSLRNPQVPRYRADLAGTRITLAQLLLEDDQLGAAALALAKPIESFEALVEQYADVPTYRSELAFALRLRGETLLDSGEAEAARRDLKRAIGELEKLTAQFPTDGEYGERLGEIRTILESLDKEADDAEQQ